LPGNYSKYSRGGAGTSGPEPGLEEYVGWNLWWLEFVMV
jgi:hypothetical protein